MPFRGWFVRLLFHLRERLNQLSTLSSIMGTTPTVCIPRELLETILEGAKQLYPRESFLVLRGKKSEDVISVSDLVVAPFAVHGNGFASYSPHMLPMDFSVVGTVHSHPSGNIQPSHVDLNHMMGRVLMIVGYPYADERCVAVYNSNGEKLVLQLTDNKQDCKR
jgi:proteasome lid subunit RPN8/RPN11